MSNDDTLAMIAQEIGLAIEPLAGALRSPSRFVRFMQNLGWNVSGFIGPVRDLAPLVDSIGELLVDDGVNQAQVVAFMGRLESVVRAIRALADMAPGELPATVDLATFKAEFPQQVLDYLLVDYLLTKRQSIGCLLQLFGVIRLRDVPAAGNRPAYVRHEVAWDGLAHVLRDPFGPFQSAYKWGQSDFDGLIVMQVLARFWEGWGLPGTLGTLTNAERSYLSHGAVPTAVSSLHESVARLQLVYNPFSEPPIEAGIGLAILPETVNDKPGVAILPYARGTAALSFFVTEGVLGNIKAGLSLAGGIALLIRPDKTPAVEAGFIDGATKAASDLSAEIIYADPEGMKLILFGERDGSRLEVSSISLCGGTRLETGSTMTAFIEFTGKEAALVIEAGDGDGFLQKILPQDGINIDFDLTIGWSNKRGLYFNAGAGFETTLPVNIDLFGVIKIDSVYLALHAKEDTEKKESAIRAAAATTVKVQLGPVSAIVERFGLQATLSFPEKGGNLGVANLDLGFKPPNGIGLVIKAQVVTGGGYLYFDFEKEQYAGVLQLEIAQKFSLTAVGLLTTKMPDGKPGFSLLVIISVRFDPGIQLGYGFSLNGLGGLLGVNRIANTKALQEGLRRGALGSILFPQNVVENAPQIISNLSAIFPPARDRFLFGPMAIIGWGGSPPLLSMEIGIILEFSESFRLMILGRLRVSLPGKTAESGQAGGSGADGEEKEQDTPKIKLQLDTLGIFDFGSGEISLDAYLYDSTIGPFTITGGMALRISFGAKPMFLLSVGGYHPAFQAPAGFPSIERVAFGLHKKEDSFEVRLQFSAYFALTSNTVQFGSHLDLYVHIAGFVEIIGLLRFDVLIQFQPFGLMASFEAMVSVKAGGQTLMAVGLQVNLTGPSPWHVWGKAHFTLLFISGTAEFDALIGKKEAPLLPPPTNVAEELFTELQKLSNWSSQLPVGENPLVTFRDSIPPKDPAATPPKKKVLVHPLAELHINQRLVPLKADPITKYGTTTPTGATTFTLTATVAAGAKAGSLVTKDLSDWFARAQFYVMSDAEKLAAPSFEQKHSGVRVTAPEGYTCGEPVTHVIEAAKLSSDPKDAQTPSKLGPAEYLDRVAHLGAAGQSPMRAAGVAKYGDPSWWDQGITLSQPGYRVVGEEDDGIAPKARATRRAGAPSPASAFEEAMDEMATIAEPIMSYSAAQTRATRARQRSPKRRTWVVPDIGRKRGGR